METQDKYISCKEELLTSAGTYNMKVINRQADFILTLPGGKQLTDNLFHIESRSELYKLLEGESVYNWLIEIKNAIEAGEGIFGKKDLFSQEDFDQIMSLITSPKATWRQITRAFARLGCLSLGQVRFSRTDRRRVWAIRNFDKWRHADPGDIQQHLQTHMDEADSESLFK